MYHCKFCRPRGWKTRISAVNPPPPNLQMFSVGGVLSRRQKHFLPNSTWAFLAGNSTPACAEQTFVCNALYTCAFLAGNTRQSVIPHGTLTFWRRGLPTTYSKSYLCFCLTGRGWKETPSATCRQLHRNWNPQHSGLYHFSSTNQCPVLKGTR